MHPAIHRYDPKTGKDEVVVLSQIVSALVWCAPKRLLVTVEQGFAFVNFTTGELSIIANPYDNLPVICNDGKCDRMGRFWSGTAAKDGKSSLGVLLRLNPDLSFNVMDKGFTLSNGLGFSPDNQYFYFTDFIAQTIYRYEFDLHTGTTKNRIVFITIPKEEGSPDGMTVDAEGCLWVALWRR